MVYALNTNNLIKTILPFLFVFSSLSSMGQSDSCETSLPFCTSDTYTFHAATNTTAQVGPFYGCLVNQPNPAWYYMKIGLPGDVEITMASFPPEDIDFICWGPFPDAFSPCAADLIESSVVDCSYANFSMEVCNIPNTQVGEYYILLITNFSNNECQINFHKTDGDGETDCSIVPPPVSNNGPLCVGDTLRLTTETLENKNNYF